jgi:uncharacterized protein YaaN involved in tellurite resistance
MENKVEEVKAPQLVIDKSEMPKVENMSEMPVEPELPVAAESRQADASGLADLEASLSEKEMAQVESFVPQINVRDTAAIMNYGAGTQKNIAEFANKTLSNVSTKDMGEVGAMITGLMGELKSLDDDEDGGIFSFFHKKKDKLALMKAKYNKIETNVTTIETELDARQTQLMKDSAMLDQMYDVNMTYFRELTMYIVAGKRRLEQVRNEDLAALETKARESGAPEDAQAAKDLAAQCERFEKKLHDLSITRTIAMQTAPQIRLVQAANNEMAEKIQSTIVNTIPLWKNQMIIALGVEHSTQAAKAQKAVSDMTNELLRKNADALEMATVEVAKESERSIVDVETLQHTNQKLIDTLDEVLRVQQEGKERRAAAEVELAAIEDQLRTKLLEAAQASR